MTTPAPRFRGKTVLVTGGGTGIGRAIAEAFAREAATVVVSGRRPAPLAATVERIRARGGDAVPADLTRSDQVATLLRTVVDRHGRLDIAVNNAGISAPGRVGELTEAAWTTSWRSISPVSGSR